MLVYNTEMTGIFKSLSIRREQSPWILCKCFQSMELGQLLKFIEAITSEP